MGTQNFKIVEHCPMNMDDYMTAFRIVEHCEATGRYATDEELTAIISYPGTAYKYAHNVLKGRWYHAEKIIATKPHTAYLYALNVIGGRFPLGEPIIATDDISSFDYAIEVLKDRFPAGEPVIRNSSLMRAYVQFVVEKLVGLDTVQAMPLEEWEMFLDSLCIQLDNNYSSFWDPTNGENIIRFLPTESNIQWVKVK